MKLSMIPYLNWILLASVVISVTACEQDAKSTSGLSSSVSVPVPDSSEAHTVCASTQVLAVDVRTTTPRLPVGGGVANFIMTVSTQIELAEAWLDIVVPAGVQKPTGYPLNIGLIVGEPYEHPFALTLPSGVTRHDIVAGLKAVHQGVDVAQFNNVWVTVGDAVEQKPVLSRSGSSMVREVRFGDSLRRDGR